MAIQQLVFKQLIFYVLKYFSIILAINVYCLVTRLVARREMPDD